MKKEEYEKELNALNEKIFKLKSQREKLVEAYMTQLSPYKVGDVLTWGKDRKGRVIRILNFVGSPAWKVVRIKKDGTEGEWQEVRAYDNPKLVV